MTYRVMLCKDEQHSKKIFWGFEQIDWIWAKF